MERTTTTSTIWNRSIKICNSQLRRRILVKGIFCPFGLFYRAFFSTFSTKGVNSKPRNSLCPWSLIDHHIVNQMILSLSWFFGMFDNFNISCFHSVSSFSSNLAMSKKLKLFFKTSFIFVAELWMSATHFRIFAFDDWKFNASHAFCFLPFPVGREPRLGSWTRGDPARLNNFALPCQRLDS